MMVSGTMNATTVASNGTVASVGSADPQQIVTLANATEKVEESSTTLIADGTSTTTLATPTSSVPRDAIKDEHDGDDIDNEA